MFQDRIHLGAGRFWDKQSAVERKIVHDRLAERSGLETFSEGEEPERCVIVAPLVGG